MQCISYVHGVLLPCISNSSQGSLVIVESFRESIKMLARNVSAGYPCLIEGPVGCGKSSLIEHLSLITGRSEKHFMKVQMGDQIDSKVLIGGYHCTECIYIVEICRYWVPHCVVTNHTPRICGPERKIYTSVCGSRTGKCVRMLDKWNIEEGPICLIILCNLYLCWL